MKKSHGFTLIELLAVIVILAVIALIATPTILGVVNTAKKGAAQASASGFIDAIEKQIAIDMIDVENAVFYNPDTEKGFINELPASISGTNIALLNAKVSMKGDKPVATNEGAAEGSIIVLSSSGIVDNGTCFVIDKYVITYDGKTVSLSDEDSCTEALAE